MKVYDVHQVTILILYLKMLSKKSRKVPKDDNFILVDVFIMEKYRTERKQTSTICMNWTCEKIYILFWAGSQVCLVVGLADMGINQQRIVTIIQFISLFNK